MIIGLCIKKHHTLSYHLQHKKNDALSTTLSSTIQTFPLTSNPFFKEFPILSGCFLMFFLVKRNVHRTELGYANTTRISLYCLQKRKITV